MRKFELGPVLFSNQVIDLMLKDSSIAARVGKGLAHHISTGNYKFLELGGRMKSSFHFGPLQAIIVTELDKNKMPRTTIVQWTENGEL